MRWASAACALLVAVVLASPRPASASEVVEPWDDGTTPHKRFFVDDAGKKQGHSFEYQRDGKTITLDATYRDDVLEGAYLECYDNGTPKVRTSYKAGKLSGKHEQFGPDGDVTESSTYVDGVLNGKRQVWQSKKLVATQTWKAGTLATLDGSPAFPRSKEETTKTVARILSGELPAGASAAKPKHAAKGKSAAAPDTSALEAASVASAPADFADQREGALRRLRAYRYLCGIPWEDVVAGPAETLAAQCASLVCSKLGRITHTPPNPGGLGNDVYPAGAKGASECNLHLGREMRSDGAMDGWMDDSDEKNIERVGHRRWALSLDLRVTGFGVSVGTEDRFWAMHTMDHSRAQPPDVPFVMFPPRGYVPSEMFGDHYAWSVSIDPVLESKIPLESAAIRIRRLSTDGVPVDADLALDTKTWHGEHIGGRSALIFRPKGLEVADGVAYVTELSVPDAKAHKPSVVLRWVTGFVGAPRERDLWTGPPSDDAGGTEGK